MYKNSTNILQKFEKISPMIWNKLGTLQINWEISLNYCSLLRKPELYVNALLVTKINGQTWVEFKNFLYILRWFLTAGIYIGTLPLGWNVKKSGGKATKYLLFKENFELRNFLFLLGVTQLIFFWNWTEIRFSLRNVHRCSAYIFQGKNYIHTNAEVRSTYNSSGM